MSVNFDGYQTSPVSRKDSASELVSEDMDFIFPSIESCKSSVRSTKDSPLTPTNLSNNLSFEKGLFCSSDTKKKLLPPKDITHGRLADFLMNSGCGANVINDIFLMYNVVYRSTKQELGRASEIIAKNSVRI